jgi:hydrogenase/urease accessory protein HupE
VTRSPDATRPLRRTLAALVVLACASACVARGAHAHPLAPSLLELREQPGGKVAVRWKTSASRPTGARIEPRLPEWCVPAGEPLWSDAATYREVRFTLDCGARGLRDATIGVSDLDVSRTLALVRVELADGRLVRSLLDGARPSMTIPERESRLAVARDYLELGVEHLLTGLDHLLFVLGLCLLVTERRSLLWTITAFTVGHSVTLTLATFDLVRFPQSVAETAIAFSIVLLAAEILREDDGTPAERSLIRRRPWAMAFGFGLLHGLGFAGALAEVGLPQSEIPLALFAFNLGIEVGQLGFVAVLLVAARLVRPLLERLPAHFVRLPAYAMGSLAAFWFFSRAGVVLAELAGR